MYTKKKKLEKTEEITFLNQLQQHSTDFNDIIFLFILSQLLKLKTSKFQNLKSTTCLWFIINCISVGWNSMFHCLFPAWTNRCAPLNIIHWRAMLSHGHLLRNFSTESSFIQKEVHLSRFQEPCDFTVRGFRGLRARRA